MEQKRSVTGSKSLTLLLFVACALFLASPIHAQGGLFGGSSRGGGIFEGGVGGIFSGFSDFFQGIFGNKGPAQTGGARIPIEPIGQTPSPPSNGPPSVDAGDYLKLTLTWDALSIGPENGIPLEKDPLEEEHRALVGCCGGNPDVEAGGCATGAIKHVLWGWCGQDPQYTDDLPKPPDLPWCEDLSDPANTRCIPKQTPGPNDKTYDMAISNKYIRRDGYLFTCTSGPMCVPQQPPSEPRLEPQADNLSSIWNYAEFQTEIYHSNDFSLFLNVENQSDHPVENIKVTYHPLSYSAADLLYSLPHNANFPMKYLGDGYQQQQPEEDGRVPVFPKVEYEHATQLTPFKKTITLSGQNFDWKNLPPFEIGPFDLEPGAKKTFPLQPSEIPPRNEIPLSDDSPGTCFDPNQGTSASATSNSPNQTTQPQRTCLDQCDIVRLHDVFGLICETPRCPDPDVCPRGCPTIRMCQYYYGLDGGMRNDHPEGAKCDKNCQTVSGCPPSYCFAGSRCIPPGPPRTLPECKEVYDGSIYYHTCSNATSQNSLLTPKKALATGCYNYPPVCPPRPPKPAGCGAITPRDFNFICDPNDKGEQSRCSGDGNEGVMPKVPDAQNRHLEFRDVTSLGGCGYEASSNNSVVGPIMFEAKYGKTRASRSVLLASIPIGGPILDDEARPFGFPASGKIKQDWGATQLAQELGPFNTYTPGTANKVGDDFLQCKQEGKTYPPRPNGSTAPIGDFLHPGIDIAPNYQEETDVNVYSTQAGWITFAGTDPKSPKSGWVVQVENDVTQDGKPDFITRYEHLLPNSIQIDTQYARAPFKIDGTAKPMGTGAYIPRNAIIGKMGDSGSPGQTQLHYEIIDQYNFTDPGEAATKSGDVTQSICTADPYSKMCTQAPAEGFYFAKDRFYTPDGTPVRGPIYKNP